MKKLSKNYLRRLIVEELSLLTEGEDIFGGGEEEEAADEGGEEEEAAEDTEEEGGEEEGGEEEEGEEGGEEGDAEGGDAEGGEEEEATGPADSGVDIELNNILADFEAQALAVTKAAEPEYEVIAPQESFLPKLSDLLFEGEEAPAGPPLDMPTFTNNVARLIQNYQSLMDMEMMIFTKSRDFLATKYGEDQALAFEEDLETNHGITFDEEPANEKPYAVGAMTAQV